MKILIFFSLIAASNGGTEFGGLLSKSQKIPHYVGQFLVLQMMIGFPNEGSNNETNGFCISNPVNVVLSHKL